VRYEVMAGGEDACSVRVVYSRGRGRVGGGLVLFLSVVLARVGLELWSRDLCYRNALVAFDASDCGGKRVQRSLVVQIEVVVVTLQTTSDGATSLLTVGAFPRIQLAVRG